MTDPAGYSLSDGRFWRIVGYNWTPDERRVLDEWLAQDIRAQLAASNNPLGGSRSLWYRFLWPDG